MKVIAISLDTLRADHLSCYGYGRPTSPNIDRIAAEGARFANVFASDIPTQPSHTSVFTGRFGVNSGIVSHFWPQAALDPRVPWLPTMMQGTGRRTGAVDHLFLMKDWFIRGYTDYMAPPGRSRACASVVNEFALPWLEDHANEDFFLFLHYWDAHIPYVPPDHYIRRVADGELSRREREIDHILLSNPTYPLFKRNHYDVIGEIPSVDYMRVLYDAEIAYLDEHIGALTRHLERLGIYDDTMLVVFADHGENMFEHEAWWDHAGLYDSVVQVPLIVRYPDRIEPQAVEAMVQLPDVFPTICEAAELAVPAGTDGRSLWPLLDGTTAWQRREVLLSECTWQAKRGIRTDRWKYIVCYDPGVYASTGPELYDLAADPAETQNLAGRLPDVAATLDRHLQAWLEQQLDGRPDPIHDVLATELPAIARLNRVIAEDQAAVLARAS
jgi:arylsulfatase A-like enzyme